MLAATVNTRGYAANRVVLELDGPGNYVGTLQSVEGGSIRTTSVTERYAGDAVACRRPGRTQYEDLTLQVGIAMVPRFWSWLRSSFDGDPQRRNGAIVALDFDNRQRWRRSFSRALIREIRFPTLDTSSSEPAFLTVKLAVEHISHEPVTGGPRYHAELEDPGEWRRQARWTSSRFSFRVDQIEQLGMGTSRIEGFTLKQGVIECPAGGSLEIRKQPGPLELPTLEVTIPDTQAAPWLRWYETFVREGRHGRAAERSGHIAYLGRGGDPRRPLMTLDLHGLGIVAVHGSKFDVRQPQLARTRVELCCRSMELDLGAGNVREGVRT